MRFKRRYQIIQFVFFSASRFPFKWYFNIYLLMLTIFQLLFIRDWLSITINVRDFLAKKCEGFFRIPRFFASCDCKRNSEIKNNKIGMWMWTQAQQQNKEKERLKGLRVDRADGLFIVIDMTWYHRGCNRSNLKEEKIHLKVCSACKIIIHSINLNKWRDLFLLIIIKI